MNLKTRIDCDRTLRLLLLLLVVGFFVRICCYRGPTAAEIEQRYKVSPVTAVAVDSKQADIGFYKITTHAVAGSETFSIETAEQWTWPWQSYKWHDYES